jgi:hypothetical protein
MTFDKDGYSPCKKYYRAIFDEKSPFYLLTFPKPRPIRAEQIKE